MIIIAAILFTIAAALPEAPYVPIGSGGYQSGPKQVVEILRDERVPPGYDGSYSFNYETADGIVRSEQGRTLNIKDKGIGQEGSYGFTFPNGQKFELRFVADENGFQPESPWLPVSPKFPHPIPEHALHQIEKAAQEDAHAIKTNSYH
ncbi:Larval cuticle protein LCP-17 [Armadillidium vulgare]|nr:Larval cuticle protein LCP-17 [Armadillidium vulgare]